MPSHASLAFALLLTACAGAPGVHAAGRDETGIASWYGDELAGRPTASGERFDPAGLTLAHRTLPLGTHVEITALTTGRSVVARVNDRGPHRSDRLVDLSRGTARLLGTDRNPLSPVRVRVLAPGEARTGLLRAGTTTPSAAAGLPAPGRYWLQVASFGYLPRAQALAERLGGEVLSTGSVHRVRIGPLPTARAAQRARDAMTAQGYADAQLLPITDQP
jgi:rare lipoprotein A